MDQRGISPVVATALLIAITVIAVATIGAFIAGMGVPPKVPSVIMKGTPGDDAVDDSGATNWDAIKFVHKSGDTLSTDDLALRFYKLGPGGAGPIRTIDPVVTTTGKVSVVKNGVAQGVATTIAPGDTLIVYENEAVYTDIDIDEFYRISLIHKPSESVIFDDEKWAENVAAW